ncbi:hypothetical protein [Pseudosporangium ferrugineum]|uniref:Membrane protein YqaA with SNARE-associated domain n=1 Tax=Pseudosporangium ferrugineum TaxID=439699 RepID=A0A2T0SF95_9ACTN|nr:hypothetical protein [Pseudosporangium ferrugineum]PRY32087.1 hypothetical protein CLV70_102298 [Pseudosporangium ferrugineum]
MIAVLAASAVGLLSAFLPFTPAEPYLIAAVATTGTPPFALGLAAETVGKVLIFLGTRGAIHSPWLRRRLTRRPRPAPRPPGRLGTLLARPRAAGAGLVRLLDRPRQAAAMLLLSAAAGVPPLLAVSVYLARAPMHPLVFAATCFLGRAIRFVVIALAPRLAGY